MFEADRQKVSHLHQRDPNAIDLAHIDKVSREYSIAHGSEFIGQPLGTPQNRL